MFTSAIQVLVLIKLRSGDSRPVIDRLKKLPAIRKLHSLTGDYDLAADLRVPSVTSLGRALAEIRMLQDVAETPCSIRLRQF